MRRIKTDWRCNLGQDTLDHLMRLSIEGPPLDQFNPERAVEMFLQHERRPRCSYDTDDNTECMCHAVTCGLKRKCQDEDSLDND